MPRVVGMTASMPATAFCQTARSAGGSGSGTASPWEWPRVPVNCAAASLSMFALSAANTITAAASALTARDRVAPDRTVNPPTAAVKAKKSSPARARLAPNPISGR